MLEIGKVNKLEVSKLVDFGVYLLGDVHDPEILLPKRYVPKDCKPGDMLDVFIYFDSEDRIIATTRQPKAMVGQVAYLKSVAVTRIGAFLDWGLEKDLFVPFKEQNQKMQIGHSYLVYIYVDDRTERIAASSRLNRWLDTETSDLEEGQKVDLIIANKTDLGFNAIINHRYKGFIFENDIFQELSTGQQLGGYIKKIREDKKVDLVLQRPGYENIDKYTQLVLKYLLDNEGFMPLNDKSDPAVIAQKFSISKKNFKKAIGALYKKKAITIEDDGIRIIKPNG